MPSMDSKRTETVLRAVPLAPRREESSSVLRVEPLHPMCPPRSRTSCRVRAGRGGVPWMAQLPGCGSGSGRRGPGRRVACPARLPGDRQRAPGGAHLAHARQLLPAPVKDLPPDTFRCLRRVPTRGGTRSVRRAAPCGGGRPGRHRPRPNPYNDLPGASHAACREHYADYNPVFWALPANVEFAIVPPRERDLKDRPVATCLYEGPYVPLASPLPADLSRLTAEQRRCLDAVRPYDEVRPRAAEGAAGRSRRCADERTRAPVGTAQRS